MIKHKSALKICAFFVLLSFSAYLPILVTEINSDKLFTQTFTDIFKEEIEHQSKLLSTTEKLKLIVTARTEKTGAINRKEVLFKSEPEKEILDEMINQIKLLTEMKIIPNMNFYEDFSVDYGHKTTYIDLNNPKETVELWSTTLKYSDFDVYVLMDSETKLIYEISISNDNYFKYEKDLQPEKFMDYLGLISANINVKKETIDNIAYYSYADDKSYFRYRFVGLKGYYSIELDF